MRIPSPARGLSGLSSASSPLPGSRASTTRRGSAVLIVLVLLACMALVAFSNSDTLASLKKEIQLIDRQQQQRYEPSAAKS